MKVHAITKQRVYHSQDLPCHSNLHTICMWWCVIGLCVDWQQTWYKLDFCFVAWRRTSSPQGCQMIQNNGCEESNCVSRAKLYAAHYWRGCILTTLDSLFVTKWEVRPKDFWVSHSYLAIKDKSWCFVTGRDQHKEVLHVISVCAVCSSSECVSISPLLPRGQHNHGGVPNLCHSLLWLWQLKRKWPLSCSEWKWNALNAINA